MSKKYKTYGIVIMTKNGAKVVGIYGNEKPNKHDIRSCLSMEKEQETNRIMNGNSGWRTRESLEREIIKVENDYIDAITAVSMNKYQVKELG
mgnify:CR=1 FL=1